MQRCKLGTLTELKWTKSIPWKSSPHCPPHCLCPLRPFSSKSSPILPASSVSTGWTLARAASDPLSRLHGICVHLHACQCTMGSSLLASKMCTVLPPCLWKRPTGCSDSIIEVGPAPPGCRPLFATQNVPTWVVSRERC